MPERYREARSEYMKRLAREAAEALRAQQEATLYIADFNNRLAAGKTIWAWPTIGAALASKHYWLDILCGSCDCVLRFDLRMKPRHPDASIRIVMRDLGCIRCTGDGQARIVRLAGDPIV